MNDNLKTRGQRIQFRRDRLGLSKGYVYKRVGISHVTFLNWENDSVKELSWVTEEKLAEVLLTTPVWLETGRADERYQCTNSNGDLTKELKGVHVVKNESIPIIGNDADGVKNIDKGFSERHKGDYINLPAKDANMFGVRIFNNDTIPGAQAGDAVVVDPNAEKRAGDEVLTIDNDGLITVGVFNYINDNELGITYITGKKLLNPKDFTHILSVVAIIRSGQIKRS